MKKIFFVKLLIPIISGIVVIFVLILSSSFFFKSFDFLTKSEIPIIPAPKDPIKEKPSFHGGKIIQHTTQEFWGIFDNDTEKNEVIEVLKPLEPETPPVNLNDENNKNLDSKDKIKTSEIPKVKDDNKIDKLVQTQPAPGSLEENQKHKVDLPLKRPENFKNYDYKENENFEYYIQLASFNDNKLADKTSKVLEEKLAVSLMGEELILMEVDLGQDKGFWWRVVTNLIDRDKAESICSLLKKEGQNCIVRLKKK